MAYTFLIMSATLLLSLLAPAWAGLSYLGSDEHAVAHTHQNVVRNYDGTVSHYAKSVSTPYSQVNKLDTRISNNVYQPAIAKTVSYAAPAPVSTVYTPHQQVYTPHQQVYTPHQQVYTPHQQHALFTQAAPVAQVAPVYQQQQHHIPAAHATYASHQPTVVHYSPAETVSHMSFDGFGTHYGF
ncbi:larval/pupal cuticle protein H1C [Drosophila grimshawi]|uniref:GH16609 n=1 Tax=Drosophila grimshawi TaxID=7222 RepID=B4J284_DROGR|nr:larval/pupal cuticle protein H1C [Drosophila grimshawi]EDV97035.1 GH16609 [Drosophila grimshawi]